MENDQIHEDTISNCIKDDGNSNENHDDMKGPFGDQSTVDPLFSSLIDDAMFPILIVSIQNESILYSNKYAQEYFGSCKPGARIALAKNYWSQK